MKLRHWVLGGLLAIANGLVVAQDGDGGPGVDGANDGAQTNRRGRGDRNRADSNPQGNPASPTRGIDRRNRAERSDGQPEDIQSIDGVGNNLEQMLMGAIHTQLLRAVPSDYADGISTLAGADRPSPRAISNAVHAEIEPRSNPFGYSDYLWQWGQFLDHDIDLTEGVEPPEPAPIPVPIGDPSFDPDAAGTVVMRFNRAIYDRDTGVTSPREQINEITGWIDGSNVYGSDSERADALRTLDGTGRLRTSDGELLPFNEGGLPNAGGSGPELFLAGDPRANEQVGLIVMHTLFVREHNRIADRIAQRDEDATGEEIYQRARRRVIAHMQAITFNEFLPLLLGSDAIAPYDGYDSSVDTSIRNVFSTAAYRLGHTMLSPVLLRLDADGAESEFGHLSLADAFFRPGRVISEGGIEPVLRGLAAQVHQRVDVYVVDEVRNFLFGLPGNGGLDLPSLNIQRGRDHGLGSYNASRIAYGLTPNSNFSDISSDPVVVDRLASIYNSPDDVDVWTGGLAEDAVSDGMVGPLFRAILVDQFEALRDGDRFWYERILDDDTVDDIEETRLSDIVRRNTNIGNELQDNVFVVRE